MSEALATLVDQAGNGRESRPVTDVLVEHDQALTDLTKQLAAVTKQVAALKKENS